MTIKLTLKNYRCFSDESPATIELTPGFTALVGPNNSGKSTLLRFFFEMRELLQYLGQGDTPNKDHPRGFSFRSVIDNNEVFFNGNNRDLEIVIDGQEQTQPSLRTIVIRPNPSFYTITNGTQTNIMQLCRELANTLYIPSFRNAINAGGSNSYYDMAVGVNFISTWRDFKTGNRKYNNEAAIGVTEEIRRILGFKQLEINSSADGTTLQLFIDGKSYWLSEVGSGISQFILVLINVAIRKPSYILIDEPEISLHPSLQIDFLTTLASYATKGVIYATHNIGLARATADRRYSVQKSIGQGAEVRLFEATARLPEFLGELTYSGYRDLGFSKVLLVEGVSDVKTIQQFLRRFHKEHEIITLPLGGSSFITRGREYELAELKRISTEVYALIDSERSAPDAPLDPQREAFIKTCQDLEITCHVLDRRATENYLTDSSIKSFLGPKYSALGPYEALENHNPSWSKAENWRIARGMNKNELMETDLGIFLNKMSETISR